MGCGAEKGGVQIVTSYDAEMLMEAVYDELRRHAERFMPDKARHTLQPTAVVHQPTAVVHEVFLRMAGSEDAPWTVEREHFLAVAATAMRQVLIDYAKRRATDKRGGSWKRVGLAVVEDESSHGVPDVDLLDLEEALQRLEQLDPQRHRIVELRYFGGLTMEEIARVTGISKATADRQWRFARAWLLGELER